MRTLLCLLLLVSTKTLAGTGLDIETYWNKDDYCITLLPPILSVLEVPPPPIFFIRPLATLELLSVWFELRCFRREEAGGWFLFHLCLPLHCQDNFRWSRHSEIPQLSFSGPLYLRRYWQDPDCTDKGLGRSSLLGSMEAC